MRQGLAFLTPIAHVVGWASLTFCLLWGLLFAVAGAVHTVAEWIRKRRQRGIDSSFQEMVAAFDKEVTR